MQAIRNLNYAFVVATATLLACGDDSSASTSDATSAPSTSGASVMSSETSTASTGSSASDATAGPGTDPSVGSSGEDVTTGDPETTTTSGDTSTTSTSTATTGTSGGPDECSVDALPAVLDIDIEGFNPIFTSTSDAIVVSTSDAILQLSLCGEVLATVAQEAELGVNALALNPDDTTLYYAYTKGFDDTGIRRVAFPDGGAPTLLLDEFAVYDVAVRPDESLLYYKINGGDAFRLDLVGPPQPQDLGISPKPRSFSFAPDGTAVAFIDNADDIYVLDVETEQLQFVVTAGQFIARGIQWLPDGERIAYTEDPLGELQFRAHNVVSDQNELLLSLDDSIFNSFQFSPDMQRLVIQRGGYLELRTL